MLSAYVIPSDAATRNLVFTFALTIPKNEIPRSSFDLAFGSAQDVARDDIIHKKRESFKLPGCSSPSLERDPSLRGINNGRDSTEALHAPEESELD